MKTTIYKVLFWICFVSGLLASSGWMACSTPENLEKATEKSAPADSGTSGEHIVNEAKNNDKASSPETVHEKGKDIKESFLPDTLPEHRPDVSSPENPSTEQSPESTFQPCSVKNFKACGGDPIGLWDVIDFCPEDPKKAQQLCEHPFDNMKECQGKKNQALCRFKRSGSLEITKDRFKMSVKSSLTAHYTFDAVCLNKVKAKPTAKESCQAMASRRLQCQFDGQLCLCEATLSTKPEDKIDEAYQLKGTKLIIAPGKKSQVEATFCVQSEKLTLDITPHPISWRYWLFQKKK